MRLTSSTLLVLDALAGGYQHGFDIMDVTALPSGTVYPILRRLEREGLVRSQWEPAEVAQREHRPPRRVYELSSGGQAVARATTGPRPARRGGRTLQPAKVQG